ncbi:MAG TPA: tetratricopeptide repeat protein [Candidatus Polarisedimenticolia bacterium]|nr:tetratricopeptide repeat protein [Candidatus Polarisedimenticolia bacterium]
MRSTKRTLLMLALGLALASAAAPLDPAHAEAITRVRGTIKDVNGKPMPKIKVFFEAADIKRKIGPVTTNKEGVYVIATLDISVAKKWRVIPDLPGYKTVKIHYEIFDSEKQERGSGDNIPGSKQEYPELSFALVGDLGRNLVDFVVAKDSEFLAAVQAEKKAREAAASGGAVAAPAGTTSADPAVAGSAPGAAAAPGAPAGPAVSGESLTKAKQLADAGRHPEAIELYKAFLTKDPTGNPAVYYYLGKSLFETKDDQAAEQAFRKASELKPDMKYAHFFLGNIHLRGDRFVEAAAEYEKETTLAPDNDRVWFQLGQALARAGQDDKALEALEKASAIDPSKSDAYMEMAAIYEKKKDRAKADEAYQKVIALDPKNAASSFFNIGVHAWNENHDREAAQAFRKAIEVDPSYAAAHRELARTLTRMQDFDGAVKHYEQYLKLSPGAPDAKEIKEMIVALKG